MIDCSNDIQDFHDEEVRLPQASQGKLRDHRTANRKRIDVGLEKSGGPAPTRHVPQGSYAMYTINQESDGAYDIDDGVEFDEGALVGSKGAPLSSLDARKLVLAAVDDKAFSTPPELKPNCVRVHYVEGHHVDIPVYRRVDDGSGAHFLEIASSTWKPSDPEAVTTWFNDAVIEKSPDEANGQQMRRVVRLLKKFAKSRTSWRLPSGFILSVLVDETYRGITNRDDESFVETIRAIHARLKTSCLVDHPVLDERLVDDESDARTTTLRSKLEWAIGELDALSGVGCTRLKALKAWKSVFNTDYFDKKIADEKAKTQAIAASLVSKTTVRPSPWCPPHALV